MNKVIHDDMECLYSEDCVDWSKFFNKTVLITGAYGMLASYMVYMLIYLNEKQNAGIKIVALGRNKDKFEKRFSGYTDKPYFNIIQQDVCNPLTDLPNTDYIIHAASPASPHFYGSNPVDVMLPNVLGTNNLLKKASHDKLEGFLFVSSGPYGNLEGKVESIRETDMGHLDPMNIRSCYDESKRCGETLCLSYFHQYDVPINCVRPSHTYGPTMDLTDSRVFANFVSDVVHGRDIEIMGDGRATRSFCYISDAILAYFKILLDAPRGEAYNVGNDDANITIEELAKLLVDLSPKKNLKIVYKNRECRDSYIPSTVLKAPILNTEKIRGLGWKWKVSLEEGFLRTISSFVAG